MHYRPEDSDPLVATTLTELADDDGADFSLAAIVGFALRHVRVLVLVPFFTAVTAMILGLAFGRAYTARSQIVPEAGSESGLGQYSALAAQVGVSLPGGLTGQSPDFYAALIKAPSTTRALAESYFEYDDGSDRVRGTLVELSKIELPTRHRTMLRVMKVLDAQIAVRPDPLTGVIEIRTTADSPELAEKMNRRLLGLIDEFNDERRRRFASAEREFIDGRIAAGETELRAAELDLQRFLEQNRGYQNSPQQMLAADRLRREVTLRQQVYTGLAQALEQARIEEVRNTPQVTVVTPPEGSADRERLLKKIVRGGFVGIVLAILLAFSVEWVQREVARRGDDFDALRRIRLRDLYGRVVGRGAGAHKGE